MLENSSYQSIFQLAVALNISYAAISTFFGNNASKEKVRVDGLITSAQNNLQIAQQAGSDLNEFISDLTNAVNLKTRIIRLEDEIETLLFQIVRVFAVLAAAVSLGFLFYTSWKSDLAAPDWIGLASIVVLAPFVFFVVYSMWLVYWRINPISSDRHKLDISMSDRLLTLAQLPVGDTSAGLHRSGQTLAPAE
jgi:hypothetical protein